MSPHLPFGAQIALDHAQAAKSATAKQLKLEKDAASVGDSVEDWLRYIDEYPCQDFYRRYGKMEADYLRAAYYATMQERKRLDQVAVPPSPPRKLLWPSEVEEFIL